jgi:acyl-CoA dehydrogenase
VRGRVLYGKSVLSMSHIRSAMILAYARMTAMKFYAYRALDYLQASGPDERRYLLFNSVQKARVSTEGVKVLGLLSECTGARGFEADTYLETALRDGPMIPSLEGSTHINFETAAQFLGNYFAEPDRAVPVPESVSLDRVSSGENPYWLGPRDRNTHTVRFGGYPSAYGPVRTVPNVGVFVRQVTEFARLANEGMPVLNPSRDQRLLIGLGRCLSVIAYGQLVAEMCAVVGATDATISLLFHGQVEDLSAECCKLASLFPPESPRRAALREMTRIPETTDADCEAVAAMFPESGRRSTKS